MNRIRTGTRHAQHFVLPLSKRPLHIIETLLLYYRAEVATGQWVRGRVLRPQKNKIENIEATVGSAVAVVAIHLSAFSPVPGVTPPRLVAQPQSVEGPDREALSIGTPLHGGDRVPQPAALVHLTTEAVPHLSAEGGGGGEAKRSAQRT